MRDWVWGIGNGALGIGHWAWGFRALGIGHGLSIAGTPLFIFYHIFFLIHSLAKNLYMAFSPTRLKPCY